MMCWYVVAHGDVLFCEVVRGVCFEESWSGML